MDKLENLRQQFRVKTVHLGVERRDLALAEEAVKNNLREVQALGREILKLEKAAKDMLL